MSKEKKYYVHVGFKVDREEIISKLKSHIPEKYIDEIKNTISIATIYFTEQDPIFMDNFYKKYLDKQVTGYLKKLYVRETKKNFLLAATIVIMGKWYYISINHNNVSPYMLKKMVNRNQLGEGIDLENLQVNCSVYRFIQNTEPVK